jgi:hypothetical protein
MASRRLHKVVLILLCVTGLSALACNLSLARSGSVGTAAAETNSAVPSPTAAATSPAVVSATPAVTATASLTPSPTPPPVTATSTPIPCGWAGFVKDVTYPDGTQVPPGGAFTKTWRVKNLGTCTWTSSTLLIFDHGDKMGAPDSTPVTSGSVAPGASVDVSVSLTAPSAPGTYQGYFLFKGSDGVIFGVGDHANGPIWVKVKVPPATPTPTTPPFAVTGGTAGVTPPIYVGLCSSIPAFSFSGTITANADGVVTYQWDRSTGSSTSPQTLVFMGAGSQTVTDAWTVGSNGSYWGKLHVLTPNVMISSQADFEVSCISLPFP